MEYAALMIMAALIQYMIMIARVGAARGKSGIKAPQCTGDDAFERTFRTHQNTLEQLIIFIPATTGFAWFVHQRWVIAPALLFLIGRALYANAYVNKPEGRGPGMIMTMLANAALVLGTVIALVIEIL